MLKPFFCYYGGKWRVARDYPPPRHDKIIEPFAGAAGYSTRYSKQEVLLLDRDLVIAELWKYLIQSNAKDILALPLLKPTDHLAFFDIPLGAQYLIGFWLNKGAASPCKSPSAWMRKGTHTKSYWGQEIRSRIAGQVEYIKHWKVIEGEYADAPDLEATWFVDPPYSNAAGGHYRHNSIDYVALAKWSRERKGQVIVCENKGADWLPFKPFKSIKANESRTGGKRSEEVVWTNA